MKKTDNLAAMDGTSFDTADDILAAMGGPVRDPVAAGLLPEDNSSVETSAAYRIGDALLSMLASQTGLSREEAAMLLIEGDLGPSGMEALSAKAAGELVRRQNAGALPFSPEEYAGSDAFTSLLSRMPVDAAFRLFESEREAKDARAGLEAARADGAQDILEKLIARRALPSSIRPGMPAAAETDYSDMSSDSFNELRRYLARSAAAGKSVKL